MNPRAAHVVAAIGALRASSSDLVADAMADAGITAPVAAWGIETTLARYTEEACAAIVPDLARPCAVLLATSVPTAPVRAITLPLLRGAPRVVVRASGRQPRVASRVVAALAAQGLPVSLSTVDRQAFLSQEVTAGSLLIAYGHDETLTAIAAALPADRAFEGHGHGFALDVVAADAGPEAALSVARDIALFDQHGCLSPQTVFVQSEDARPFAAALHAALDQLAHLLPRGPMDASEAAALVQWLGAHAPFAAAVHRARSHVVLAMERCAFVPSPGFRHVAVVPFDTLEGLHATLEPYVTAVGTAGSLSLRSLFPRARHVAVGTLQDPPLDGPEDPRPPWVTRR